MFSVGVFAKPTNNKSDRTVAITAFPRDRVK